MSVGNIYQGIEKRKANRCAVDLEVFVNKGINSEDNVFNMSREGVCFGSNNTFKPNDFILFHFTKEDDSYGQNIKFSILGKIVWRKENGSNISKYGAQFKFYDDPFSDQQRNKLCSYFDAQ